MTYEKVQLSDLDEIISLYGEAISDMARSGIDQWDAIYPDRNVLERDIKNGDMLNVKIEGKTAAAAVINREQDAGYQNGAWRYTSPDIAVIHRLCVRPGFQGRGVASALMRHCEELLILQGYSAVRLDAFSKNPAALRLYTRLGYEAAGETRYRKGVFIMFEKALRTI